MRASCPLVLTASLLLVGCSHNPKGPTTTAPSTSAVGTPNPAPSPTTAWRATIACHRCIGDGQ